MCQAPEITSIDAAAGIIGGAPLPVEGDERVGNRVVPPAGAGGNPAAPAALASRVLALLGIGLAAVAALAAGKRRRGSGAADADDERAPLLTGGRR